MCCQIPLWCGLAVRLFSDNKIIYTIVYVGCAFVTFYFLYHYESNLAQHFMPKANKSVYILGILPLCYYLFDYASTIYTDMLYTSNEFVVQFMPSICCIFYFVFIFYYYHKLEEQEQAERLAESLHMQLTHAAIDLNHMRTMQTQAASYRHDMRHHFTYLQALAGTGNLDKIQEYIQTAQSDLDAITPKRFCSNELINPEVTTGGRALKFYASVRMDVRRIDTLKMGGEIVGNRTRVKVVKNKVAPPFKEAEFDIMFGKGISREGDILDLAVANDIVDKSGAWYAYMGDKIGQGRENAKAFLAENPAICAEIDEKIREKLGLVETEDAEGTETE